MHLKQTLIIAFTLGLISVIAWESYWRSQGFYPTLDDNEALWSVQRNRVKTTTDKDIILLGSSRVLFDIQLNEWEALTGIRPIQLASAGSSPLPMFHDLVANTEFKGTIVVGVTPGLFFSTVSPQAEPWAWPQSRVDYYKNRTLAQETNHILSLPLQKNLAFVSEDQGVDGIKLKELLGQITIGNRAFDPFPPFHEFGLIEEDRNLKMKPITVTDTAYANSIIKVWQFFIKGAASGPPPEKEATTAFFLNDLKKFEARGGRVILIRCPSSGSSRVAENMGLPRTEFWDSLVKQSNLKSYHFEDYEQLKYLICPEESHLSGEDAQYFTTELVKIMQADGVLSQPTKNN